MWQGCEDAGAGEVLGEEGGRLGFAFDVRDGEEGAALSKVVCHGVEFGTHPSACWGVRASFP